jgi:hypothetical protein
MSPPEGTYHTSGNIIFNPSQSLQISETIGKLEFSSEENSKGFFLVRVSAFTHKQKKIFKLEGIGNGDKTEEVTLNSN